MRITEAINFSHELSILEAHLEEHSSFIDRFIIKESPVLFTGTKHPLLFQENKERFSRFSCEHIIVPSEEYTPLPSKIEEKDFNYWFNVRRQNRVKSKSYGWEDIRKDCDYVISSDADEIISSARVEILLDLLKNKEYEHVSIRVRQAQFWVNFKGKKRNIYRIHRGDLPFRYSYKGRHRTLTPNIGWHFSNCFKKAEDLRTKAIGISTHYGYDNLEEIPTAEDIESLLSLRKNPFLYKRKGRDLVTQHKTTEIPLKIASKETLPKFIQENQEQFRWLSDDLCEK